jgi:hypothetical protein
MFCRQFGLLASLFLTISSLNCAVAQENNEEATEAEPEKESFFSQFKDPDDGMIDISEWLLDNIVGFLPVPIIITEPAVDNGIGAAGVFFHQPKADQMKPDADGEFILPNVSAVAVAVTGNDSWIVGGGHFRNWGKDHYRYNVFGGYANINLDWYGGDDFPVLENGIRFNAEGAVLDQEFLFRLGDSDWFLGADWQFMKSDITFKTSLPIELPTVENTVSGLSAVALYENLDYQISPRNGLNFRLQAEANKEAFGSDYDFEKYTWKLRQYFEFGEKYTLSWRLDGATTSGDIPFYLEPFVEIEGIPAMRYQGGSAATLEVRGGYDIRPRWTAIGFVGGGRAAENLSDLGSATTRTAYGLGFRYLMAKKLGMRVGLDVATGPDGTYVYIVMGSAW